MQEVDLFWASDAAPPYSVDESEKVRKGGGKKRLTM